MATILKNAKQRAAMTAKEERARDAVLAMQEYEAEKLAVRTNTARLRALRGTSRTPSPLPMRLKMEKQGI
jgi:anti-sigma factor ChrR (cupin superfamily)